MSAPNYEQLKNGPQTTLNGSILSGATSLVVSSATGFPTVGNFRILIESEIFLVTAVSGTTFTVSPGQEGTTQAGHASSATVTHVFTAGAAKAYRSDAILNDTFANRPSAGVLGRIFIPSNSDILCYDTGSVWEHFGPLNQWTQPPLAAGFTQGNGTHPGVATDDSGTIYLTSNPQTSWNICDQYIAKPGTPFTIIANFCLDAFNNSNSTGDLAGCGIHIRTSGTGKIVTHNAWLDTATVTTQVSVTEFSGYGTVNADELAIHQQAISLQNIWMKFTDDGVNRTWYLSNDGRNWTQIFQTATGTYVGAYDQVGWSITTNVASNWVGTPAAKLRSWKQS